MFCRCAVEILIMSSAVPHLDRACWSRRTVVAQHASRTGITAAHPGWSTTSLTIRAEAQLHTNMCTNASDLACCLSAKALNSIVPLPGEGRDQGAVTSLVESFPRYATMAEVFALLLPYLADAALLPDSARAAKNWFLATLLLRVPDLHTVPPLLLRHQALPLRFKKRKSLSNTSPARCSRASTRILHVDARFPFFTGLHTNQY